MLCKFIIKNFGAILIYGIDTVEGKNILCVLNLF
jgi:hypothetical protein